jgi:hypothetical protein
MSKRAVISRPSTSSSTDNLDNVAVLRKLSATSPPASVNNSRRASAVGNNLNNSSAINAASPPAVTAAIVSNNQSVPTEATLSPQISSVKSGSQLSQRNSARVAAIQQFKVSVEKQPGFGRMITYTIECLTKMSQAGSNAIEELLSTGIIESLYSAMQHKNHANNYKLQAQFNNLLVLSCGSEELAKFVAERLKYDFDFIKGNSNSLVGPDAEELKISRAKLVDKLCQYGVNIEHCSNANLPHFLIQQLNDTELVNSSTVNQLVATTTAALVHFTHRKSPNLVKDIAVLCDNNVVSILINHLILSDYANPHFAPLIAGIANSGSLSAISYLKAQVNPPLIDALLRIAELQPNSVPILSAISSSLHKLTDTNHLNALLTNLIQHSTKLDQSFEVHLNQLAGLLLVEENVQYFLNSDTPISVEWLIQLITKTYSNLPQYGNLLITVQRALQRLLAHSSFAVKQFINCNGLTIVTELLSKSQEDKSYFKLSAAAISVLAEISLNIQANANKFDGALLSHYLTACSLLLPLFSKALFIDLPDSTMIDSILTILSVYQSFEPSQANMMANQAIPLLCQLLEKLRSLPLTNAFRSELMGKVMDLLAKFNYNNISIQDLDAIQAHFLLILDRSDSESMAVLCKTLTSIDSILHHYPDVSESKFSEFLAYLEPIAYHTATISQQITPIIRSIKASLAAQSNLLGFNSNNSSQPMMVEVGQASVPATAQAVGRIKLAERIIEEQEETEEIVTVDAAANHSFAAVVTVKSTERKVLSDEEKDALMQKEFEAAARRTRELIVSQRAAHRHRVQLAEELRRQEIAQYEYDLQLMIVEAHRIQREAAEEEIRRLETEEASRKAEIERRKQQEIADRQAKARLALQIEGSGGESIPLDIEAQKFLQKGGNLLRYTASALSKAKSRFCYLTKDCKFFVWLEKSDDFPDAKNRFRTKRISKLLLGKQTDILKKKPLLGSGANEKLCFSLVGKSDDIEADDPAEITLDLEAKTIEERDLWVNNLKKLVDWGTYEPMKNYIVSPAHQPAPTNKTNNINNMPTPKQANSIAAPVIVQQAAIDDDDPPPPPPEDD